MCVMNFLQDKEDIISHNMYLVAFIFCRNIKLFSKTFFGNTQYFLLPKTHVKWSILLYAKLKCKMNQHFAEKPT